MSWHQVILTNPAMAQTAMDDLLQQWRAVYQAAGKPADAAVFRSPTTADAVFYFSPTASLLAKDILWVFGETICPQPPNLDTLEKVHI
jgi:hypothetical protein